MLFADPSSRGLCLMAYFFGYPALFLSAFFFEKRKVRALYVYGCGVFYFLVQMLWLGNAQYHGAWIVYVYYLLACIFPVGFYVVGYFLPRDVKDLTLLKILELSFLFAGFEYLRLFVVCGFPFHTAGLILLPFDYLLILASVVGEYGLSFTVVMVGLYSAKCILLNRPWRVVAFALMPILFGHLIHSSHLKSAKYSEKISVAIVQTGLKVEEKGIIPHFEDAYISMKDQLCSIWECVSTLEGVDLICLPEAAFAGDGVYDRYTKEDLEEIFPRELAAFFYGKEEFSNMDVFLGISLYLKVDVLIGLVVDRENAMFYLSGGKMVGTYVKRRLLPIGEYIPFDFLKPIAKLHGLEGSFKKGKSFDLLESKWRILPTICFDEGFPQDFIRYHRLDPKMHINISNDAWFIGSKLVNSHLAIGRLRSVENGMYSIRAGNIGVSAIISPMGVVEKHLPTFDGNGLPYKGVLIDSFTPYKVETIFSKVGNPGLCLVVLMTVALMKLFSRREIFVKA